MTTRLLPPEEWDRLPAEHRTALDRLKPEDARVVVVEQDGAIVGIWAVLRIVHLEGVWIDPAYRKTGSVARRLVRAAFQVARAWAPWVMTGSQSEDVTRLLVEHLGAQKLPMETFVVEVGA